ncbi:hypothetical protein TVAG_163780 [Trichomonas vaginalis G3]|uniref:UDENN FLCN/SMCR8-type domain-containing protein n=1 Tax=Trichomonas vaginalis (strain ATCC PRA-98 / G3) TaxID=412133 RepID=A2DG55_TRIV3|nr:hypothetical protein TVAGG3_0953850 [Trichomonas vaginalis G3]EAY20682.1 hypothetical protein TVAG_163780 [Trichomonas vaginalis G3]KAI5487403.1 hypothetical protein TVAGG3_0953850 [Trichomonas vaginalis G3]|eukprot:XP_001581668.1 hypothetical protein [Trichomonas vaginalis G3]
MSDSPHSKPPTGSFRDSPFQFNNITSETLYCALFEFLQNSQPIVVWRYRDLEQKTEFDLMWYIMSVPNIAPTSEPFPKPTFMSSSFENFSFCAIYALIPDIEARGFTRSICLTVVTQKPEIIYSINSLYNDKLLNILDQARINAASLFKAEIDPHIEAITQYLKNTTIDENAKLHFQTKLEKLLEIRDNFTIETHSVKISKERCLKYATELINYDLRKIEFMIDLPVLQNQIFSILNILSLPTSVIATQLYMPSIATSVYVPNIEIPEGRGLLHLYKNNLLKNSLYSIMTGKTLIIVSSTPDNWKPLAYSLASLSPFRWKNDILQFNCPVKQTDCLSATIVVAQNIIGADSSYASVLNMDSLVFQGKQCPEKSCINKFQLSDKHNEGTFWLRLNYAIRNVKERFSRFTLIHLTRTPPNEEELNSLLQQSGFNQCDIPIFAFWTASSRNSERRPLIISVPQSQSQSLFSSPF